MDFTSLNAALVQTKAIGGGGESTGCHHPHIWQLFPPSFALLYLFHAVTYQKATDAEFLTAFPLPPVPPLANLQLLVRAGLQSSCVLLVVFFFLLLLICLVYISTLSVPSFSLLFCLVLLFWWVFFTVFEESQLH